MHDPKVVAFTIPRPWPRRWTHGDAKTGQPRWQARYTWATWRDIYKPGTWKRFWTIAGRGLYWPGLITVWHNEPGGRDWGEVCRRGGNWRWHIHHWSFQIHPWQTFRRWAFTRCEWCSGRSRKTDPVNISHQWDRDRGQWWRGERGLFHHDCSTIKSAHGQCLCERGPWENETGGSPYGLCASCGKYRGWTKEPRPLGDEAMRLLATIPAGARDADKTARAKALFQAQDRPQGK